MTDLTEAELADWFRRHLALGFPTPRKPVLLRAMHALRSFAKPLRQAPTRTPGLFCNGPWSMRSM